MHSVLRIEKNFQREHCHRGLPRFDRDGVTLYSSISLKYDWKVYFKFRPLWSCSSTVLFSIFSSPYGVQDKIDRLPESSALWALAPKQRDRFSRFLPIFEPIICKRSFFQRSGTENRDGCIFLQPSLFFDTLISPHKSQRGICSLTRLKKLWGNPNKSNPGSPGDSPQRLPGLLCVKLRDLYTLF